MPRNKYALIILPLFLLTACIEEYVPQYDSGENSLYVIDGMVSTQPGPQHVTIMKSASIYGPGKLPVDDCTLRMIDQDGNSFVGSHIREGRYTVNIEPEYLTPGRDFMLEVTTPEGMVIQSAWETLLDCPPIDSFYYEIEEFITDNDGTTRPGIQFYADYNGEGYDSRLVQYEIEETWQYEMDYPIKWTWNGWRLTTYEPPDWSLSVCWRTTYTDRIYSFSTEDLATNRYKRYKLHNVLNNSRKLLIGYSVLLKQMTISEEALDYLEKITENTIESGGLYETQPQQVNGNLTNITDPEVRVLGYFTAAGMSSMRMNIRKVEGLDLDPFNACTPISLDLGYRILRPLSEPVYLWLEEGQFLLDPLCVDCKELGGDILRPEFWPEEWN